MNMYEVEESGMWNGEAECGGGESRGGGGGRM